MYYDSEAVYVNSATDAASKIVRIDACINALLDSVLQSVGTANVAEYMLNDGQTIIKGAYRSPDMVIRSVETLRKLKAAYAYDINGGAVRMVDAKNLYRR